MGVWWGGGYVDEGLRMYEVMKEDGDVKMEILGMRGWMGRVLWMGGKDVEM